MSWLASRCSANGPHGEICTEFRGHAYSHYDARYDNSWNDRDTDHPDKCPCDRHRAIRTMKEERT